MKKTSAELKRLARENLKGHYGLLIGALVVVGLIVTTLNLPFSLAFNIYHDLTNFIIYMIATCILSLLSVIFSSGQLRMHLALARKETSQFSDLFYGFTVRPDRFILSSLVLWLLSFVVMIPSVICFITGIHSRSLLLIGFAFIFYLGAFTIIILVNLRFAFVTLLLTEQRGIGILDAFRESSRLMATNKGRLFYLGLSYLGWFIICTFSCFIGSLWVTPYMTQSFVLFYLEAADAPNQVGDTAAPDNTYI